MGEPLASPAKVRPDRKNLRETNILAYFWQSISEEERKVFKTLNNRCFKWLFTSKRRLDTLHNDTLQKYTYHDGFTTSDNKPSTNKKDIGRDVIDAGSGPFVG